MTSLAPKQDLLDLTITHRFKAPREKVFKAWTKSRHLINWWAGGDVTMTAHKMDIHPGGLFHCDFKEGNGNAFSSQGVYREMVEPSHLAFTHSWVMNGKTSPETMVTVEFAEDGDNTDMVFYQSGFSDEQSRDKHDNGWNNCFSKLDKYLTKNEDF